MLLPARVLECRKAGSTSPGAAAGGYRYLVELHANGRRLETVSYTHLVCGFSVFVYEN